MFYEVAGHTCDLENKYLHRGWWLAPLVLIQTASRIQRVYLFESLSMTFALLNRWHSCVVPHDLWLLTCELLQQSVFWLPVWTSCLTFVLLPSCAHLVQFRTPCRSHPHRICYNSCMVADGIWYSQVCNWSILSFGCTRTLFEVLTGFMAVLLLYFL